MSPQLATFAGGCFWCTEKAFDEREGIISKTVGYMGGYLENPSYEEVCSGKTGHVEALQITYDPTKISYEKLLEIYWQSIDPTQANGQFCDIGSQYASLIFYHTPEQKRLAEKSKEALAAKSPLPIVVQIKEAGIFYPAESYHQEYHKKNKEHYKRYYEGSGRAEKLKK